MNEKEIYLTLIIAMAIVFIAAAIYQEIEYKKIERNMNENDFIIRQPKLDLVVYILFIVLFAALFFLPLLLSCLIPIILLHRWKVTVKENQITFTPYFSKTKTFPFDHITKAKERIISMKGKDIIYMDVYHNTKKLFSVPHVCPGFNILVSRLKSEGVYIEEKI